MRDDACPTAGTTIPATLTAQGKRRPTLSRRPESKTHAIGPGRLLGYAFAVSPPFVAGLGLLALPLPGVIDLGPRVIHRDVLILNFLL